MSDAPTVTVCAMAGSGVVASRAQVVTLDLALRLNCLAQRSISVMPIDWEPY